MYPVMKIISKHLPLCLTLSLAAQCATPALAQTIGAPHDWQLGFQEAATPVAERMHHFHTMLLYIITGISLFVLALLVYIVLRFNARANPVPSTRTHNVPLEVIWTVLPVVILIVIAVPSMKLLYYGDRTATPDMTLKVTGYQWYWGYEYPDNDGYTFLSNIIKTPDIDVSKGQIDLLSVDNPVVLPIDTNIQIIVTAQDVIHSFAVPAFGIKSDAVPGRLNQTWVRIEKPGTFYGQCSELCGQNHGYMPIEVRAVPKEDFAGWVKAAAASKDYLSFDDFKSGKGAAAPAGK